MALEEKTETNSIQTTSKVNPGNAVKARLGHIIGYSIQLMRAFANSVANAIR